MFYSDNAFTATAVSRYCCKMHSHLKIELSHSVLSKSIKIHGFEEVISEISIKNGNSHYT